MGVKTVIILNQQSPILHFQHQQQGATLRASEVKPKLDRFIKEKIAGLPEATEAEKKIKQELYKAENFVAVKKEDLQTNSFDAYALNYKLRFENISRSDICEPADIYYGNMKLSDAEKTKTVFCSSVRMTLICFNSALLSYIEKHIEEFFVVTNFGRMQNKGFGSFTVAEINGEPTKRMSHDEIALCLKKAFGAKVCYAFDVTDTTNSRTNAFSKIKTLYSVINGWRKRSFFVFI
ncbi:MAG: hypothetical protein IJO68_04340 [Clostridia bacterium]|nr:hypothetical protein [Clostridia bacterium]